MTSVCICPHNTGRVEMTVRALDGLGVKITYTFWTLHSHSGRLIGLDEL